MNAPIQNGVALFALQLGEQGYQVDVDGDWIELDFEVPGGTHSGETVRLAIPVPKQFPTAPPSGIHFAPRLRPLNPNAQHPARSHPTNRFGNRGGEYWSRPHPDWNREPIKDAATYLKYVRELWLTT